MNDVMEDNKNNIKLQPQHNAAQGMNHQINNTRTTTHQTISSQYHPSQVIPQPITTSSNHTSNPHHTPMLGSHEMVATSNSSNPNNMHSQNTQLPQTQQGNNHLSHQPHLQLS